VKLADVDEKKLLPVLESLAAAVEQMLLSGLSTASDATRRTLAVSFQEASRQRLLRLGSTLRVANEELGRFTRNEAEFSKRRLSFFLGRTWLLSRGLARAIRKGDEQHFQQLLYVPPATPAAKLEVVTLGVAKKHVKDTFCGFDFRLRTIGKTKILAAGQPLVWSCIFPLKPGAEVPPEGFLHLPQKQGFKPHLFLQGRSLVIEKAAVALDERGGGRLILSEKSQVTQGREFSAWEDFACWDPQQALQHIASYAPGPFDLEIDLQEEVVLRDWEFVDNKPERRDGYWLYTVSHGGAAIELRASASGEGEALRQALKALAKAKTRPPLYGLMHYQMCRLVMQPLALLEDAGPKHLMISEKNVDKKALLAALKF
jgi:hypothetical protein